ncbi:MAG: PIN domain-containing protein [Nitrospirae bacterium]|nr:PIN domain-containing protein [Nitrospirota bacterium]
MGSRICLFDTSVFIDHLRTNKYGLNFQNLHGLIRNSSVVLSELARGATKEIEREFVRTLARNHPVLTPSEKNWIESGELLSKMYQDKGFTPEKLRDLHFDVLIALTARNHGATVITSNKADFELIKAYRNFNLEIFPVEPALKTRSNKQCLKVPRGHNFQPLIAFYLQQIRISCHKIDRPCRYSARNNVVIISIPANIRDCEVMLNYMTD